MFRIQELRTAKGLTQRELAEKIGVKNYIVANWEQNRTEPSVQDLQDLADFFECSVDYLIGRENDFGQIVLMREQPSEYTKVCGLYGELSEEKKKVVMDLLQVLQK